MKSKPSARRLALPFALAATLALISFAADAQSKQPKLKPQLIDLNDSSSDYQQVLKGPPQTVSMESGLVVLAPSKSVGKHSTRKYEEVVIVLGGSGEMRITGGPTLKLRPNVVAYCPPSTEHDVFNTGSQPLRYLYIVSKSLLKKHPQERESGSTFQLQGATMQVINVGNAEHYTWGTGCDGWRLLNHPDLAVIQERVPPGLGEVKHYHAKSRQLFFVLKGSIEITVGEERLELREGDSLEISPKSTHKIWNPFNKDASFLVVSAPSTVSDRV